MRRTLTIIAVALLAWMPAQGQDAGEWNVIVRQSGLLDVTLTASSYDFTASDSVIYAVYSRAGGSVLASYDCDDSEVTCSDGSLAIVEAVADIGCTAGRTCWHELMVRESGDPARAVWLAGS